MPSQNLALSSLGKYFPYSFQPVSMFHIYDATLVGMMITPCKAALLSCEFNESTLHRKKLFGSGLLCSGPHFQSLELKLVSDSVVSSL